MVIMDQPTDARASIPVSVIGQGHEFRIPYRFNIIIEMMHSSGNLYIRDINGSLLLKSMPQNTTIHHQRVLLDAQNRHLVTLREKHMTEHGRWNAFKGNSISDSDILFTTKRSHMIQRKTAVDVFLAKKDDCAFKIRGSWSQRNCSIYVGDSSTIIAQMEAMQPTGTGGSMDTFMVTINQANVDYAFVVALIAIVDAMKSSDRLVAGATTMSKVIGGALGIVGAGVSSFIFV